VLGSPPLEMMIEKTKGEIYGLPRKIVFFQPEEQSTMGQLRLTENQRPSESEKRPTGISSQVHGFCCEKSGKMSELEL